MINELYVLYQSLHKCGVIVEEQNQDVKTPGKGEGFVVGINSAGLPTSVEYADANQMARLWKISKGKHHSFPYVKLKKPIWEVEVQSIEEAYKALKSDKNLPTEVLKKCCEGKAFSRKQDISISGWTKEKINTLRGKHGGLVALTELNSRFPKDKNQSDALLRTLAGLILQKDLSLKLDLRATLLIGKIKEERDKKKIVCDVPLFFDLSDWQNAEYKYRVASPDMGALVAKNLGTDKSANGTQGRSAFEEEDRELHAGPYPDPTLPIIGSTYLFSMNEDALCHYRYGKISSAIFPISQDDINGVQASLKWCVAGERKGMTWQGVPNSKRKQDLLITYLEEKPQEEVALASCFTSFDVQETETIEAVYEKRAKTVCDALRGKDGLKHDSKVNVLVMAKVDPGRAQVVLSGSYTIENIINSIEQWQIAAKNRPHFSVLLPGKKGEKAVIMEPFCPSPTEVMRCLQNQWIKNGLDKSDVPGVALRHVYDLFLGEGRVSHEAARMILQLILQRLGPLFIGIAGADCADDVTGYSSEARKTVLTGISILAIVLLKLGIRKERYMEDAAFNVGRLLAFADGLHVQYCKLQMKKEKLPPQLMGNAVMRTALDNPTQALALLAQRIAPYHAWATKVQGKEYALAKWFLSEMGQISDLLKEIELPTATDDAMKAQILLGYLARSKSEE